MDLQHRQRIGRNFLKTINSKWGANLPLSIVIAATESHEWKKKTHGDEDTGKRQETHFQQTWKMHIPTKKQINEKKKNF